MSESSSFSSKTLRNRRKRERKRLKTLEKNEKNASSLSSKVTQKRKLPSFLANAEENIFAHYSNVECSENSNGSQLKRKKKNKKTSELLCRDLLATKAQLDSKLTAMQSMAKSHTALSIRSDNNNDALSNDSNISHDSIRMLPKSNLFITSSMKSDKRKHAKLAKRLLPSSNDSQCLGTDVENGSEQSHDYENRQEILSQRRSLPIFTSRKRLMSLFMREDCMIFKGETACGKTTQIPQFILEGGLTNGKAIGITQPRRVAAMSIAERVALEVGTTLGGKVGYCIRFEDVTSSDTKIKYLTDGMLLRESISDPLLSAYSWVILDEAHERTIHTDVLLGVVKSAQSKRKESSDPLKVIVMSATINVDQLVEYFDKPVVENILGREFSIEIYHSNQVQDDYFAMALSTVFHIHQNNDEGDILVFLTGEEEIESAVEETKKLMIELTHPDFELFPCGLYAALPSQAQQTVLKPSLATQRKVIYSTNIAETSLTIPGVKYVVDSGMVKLKTFNPVSGMDLLKIQRISKAQAEQRTGRAGRECRGCCYRLYTVEQFQEFMDFPVPEIKRCNLASVLLQIIAIGITDVKNFDFLDKPSEENIDAAIEQLRILEAVNGQDSNLCLTELGRKMVKFPLDPRFSKIVINSAHLKCTDEILTIISLLSVESLFFRHMNEKEIFEKVRKRFSNGEGDHIMLLNLYKAFRAAKTGRGWCIMHYVNFKNIKKAFTIRKQLAQICQKIGIPPCSCSGETSFIKKCLSTGLFMNAAHQYKNNIYKTIGSKEKVFIHPSSSLFQTKPTCCIYTDLVETSKRYMRNISPVDEDWLLEAAPEYFRNHRFNRFQLMSV